MSSSEGTRGEGTIRVDGPLGVEISIANGAFQEVASGVSRLTATLRDGVYAVRSTAAGRSQQQIVRLRGGQDVRIESNLRIDDDHQRALLEEAEGVLLAGGLVEPHAGIAVLAVDPTGASLPRSLLPQIRSLAGGRVGPRYPTTSVLDRARRSGSDGKLLRRKSLSPGPYALTFRTFERQIVRQVVYVLPGRHTVVLLKLRRETGREENSGKQRRRTYRGFDPGLTIITSIRSDAPRGELSRGAFTAELLLHRLQARERGTDPGLVEEVARSTEDPYVQLYAATAALASPGRPLERLAAALEDTSPESPQALEAARTLAAKLRHFEDWSDVRCLVNRVGSSLQGGRLLPVLYPPMLEICWRWASAISTSPGADGLVGPALAQEARHANPEASPWFVLAGAAQVPVTPDEHTTAASDLDKALEGFSGMLASAIDRGLGSLGAGRAGMPGINLAKLSPTSERVVRAVLAAGDVARRSKTGSRFVGHLAASLATPAAALGSALQEAAQEMSQAIKEASASGRGDWNSDPHKGRFGGTATSANASVRLDRFDEQEGIDYLALKFLVEGKRVQGPVTFYLHPTFSPSEQRAFARNSKAKLHCYAWGAFTLGVEISTGIRLELDLSALPELPEWFRNR